MSKLRPASAKILVHGEGLGTPHSDLVRKRAEEIARINGRSQYSEADWRQAKIELHGHSPDDPMSDEMGMAAYVSEQDMIACDAGHHVERLPLEDDGNVIEELVSEGMDEAEHDRMLAARDAEEEEDDEEED